MEKGILDYEDERGVSYGSDWDGFHGYMKDLMNGFFTKSQLSNKVWKMKTRFRENKARSDDGKGLSFTNTHDEEIFKFSKFVWAENETYCADSSENMQEQQQKVATLCSFCFLPSRYVKCYEPMRKWSIFSFLFRLRISTTEQNVLLRRRIWQKINQR